MTLIARLFSRWRGDDTHVSAAWLTDQERREQRVEFHSGRIAWPLNKVLNEHPGWNTKRLRRRA